ncbi:MAG TPA: phytanoyl-CoA dioxygenase family protein [Tepidisphaeraceae bacterium]|nr:phytanoyl-CoA dioxygenase family protein [Tepidisphaeraceae bacterium]
MLTEAQVAFFKANGYVKGNRVLSDDQVEQLREETLRVIRQREDKSVRQPVMCHNMMGRDAAASGAGIWQIVNIWMASDPFLRHALSNPTVCEEVAQLHDDANALRIWHDQIQYKPSGKGGVNMWHQDSPYWGILTPKHAQVTAWVALDDVDEGNGCMSMVPESHLWGNAIGFLHTLKNFDDLKQVREWEGHPLRIVTCPVRKGEVHYHHSMTWHGSHANTSDRPRRAVALHYMTDETRYVAGGDHVMKQFVHANDGDVLTGDAFPVVFERAKALANA